MPATTLTCPLCGAGVPAASAACPGCHLPIADVRRHGATAAQGGRSFMRTLVVLVVALPFLLAPALGTGAFSDLADWIDEPQW